MVLLCSIHVGRYFREKVLTGKAYWGDISEKNFLNGSEKDDLMKQVIAVRDSPSQELYEEREARLIEITKDFSITPGQVTKPVLFRDYYFKCWKMDAFRWVYAYHKNLPTMEQMTRKHQNLHSEL